MRSARLREAPHPTTPDLRWLADAGELLRDSRLQAGISQQLLGLMTGTTQQTVSRWEQGLGAPEVGTRDALVEILGLPDDLWSPPAQHPGRGRAA